MATLYGVCLEGNINKVLNAIKKGADDWDDGLFGACQGGHINIINMMIEKGADDWDWGLDGASQKNNMDIVKIMIEKGASNVDLMYQYPCKYIINLLELGLPINKLHNISGYGILVKDLKQFKTITYNELYNYMPKDLVNLVTVYCLL